MRPDAALEDLIASIIWGVQWDNPNDPTEERLSWSEALEFGEGVNSMEDSDVFRNRYTARLIIAALREVGK